MTKNQIALLAGAGASLLTGVAHAEIVTTGITTAVADAATAVGVIGAAVVLVVLAVKTYKWLARSL